MDGLQHELVTAAWSDCPLLDGGSFKCWAAVCRAPSNSFPGVFIFLLVSAFGGSILGLSRFWWEPAAIVATEKFRVVRFQIWASLPVFDSNFSIWSSA